jgi:hypothetical protein
VLSDISPARDHGVTSEPEPKDRGEIVEAEGTPAPVQALRSLRALAEVEDALADTTTLDDLY